MPVAKVINGMSEKQAKAVAKNATSAKTEATEETKMMQGDEAAEQTSSKSTTSKKSKRASKEKKSIYDLLEEDIRNSDLSLQEQNEHLARLLRARNKKVNIILVGATGSGKSSTVNALFDMSVAKVGMGVDPETSVIDKYDLDNLTIWDTPGLGDGLTDEEYGEMIVEKLSEFDENGDPLIDLVLVVVDASSKDLGTTYSLINDVVIPSLGDDAPGRILIGINQADMAMKGKHWDEEKNEPDEVLYEFLRKKAISIKNRIESVTGVETRPIFYCAGYTDENGDQCKPYNLTKLLYYIVKSVPAEKRLSLADNINDDEDNWLYDDDEEDYKGEVKKTFFQSVRLYIKQTAEKASDLGYEILGIPGDYIGRVLGTQWGLIKGFFKTMFGHPAQD